MSIKISLFVITFILLVSNANAEVIAYYEFTETQGGASNALNSVEGSTISPLNNNWGNFNGIQLNKFQAEFWDLVGSYNFHRTQFAP